MSVITVMLYGWIRFGVAFRAFDLKVGGLNETELYDLRQIPTPFPPLRADEVRFGVYAASFGMTSLFTQSSNYLMSEPPVESVAPYLSRIKSWGYKITFYNSYFREMRSDIITDGWIPILSHTWILEKDSELRFLPPNPPATSTAGMPTATSPIGS